MTQKGEALFGLASHLCGHNRYPYLGPLSVANLEEAIPSTSSKKQLPGSPPLSQAQPGTALRASSTSSHLALTKTLSIRWHHSAPSHPRHRLGGVKGPAQDHMARRLQPAFKPRVVCPQNLCP